MKRKNIINTSVTLEAKAIYDGLHPRTKGIWVSDAIVEKHDRDTGTGLEARLEDIEKRLERLEGGEG